MGMIDGIIYTNLVENGQYVGYRFSFDPSWSEEKIEQEARRELANKIAKSPEFSGKSGFSFYIAHDKDGKDGITADEFWIPPSGKSPYMTYDARSARGLGLFKAKMDIGRVTDSKAKERLKKLSALTSGVDVQSDPDDKENHLSRSEARQLTTLLRGLVNSDPELRDDLKKENISFHFEGNGPDLTFQGLLQAAGVSLDDFEDPDKNKVVTSDKDGQVTQDQIKDFAKPFKEDPDYAIPPGVDFTKDMRKNVEELRKKNAKLYAFLMALATCMEDNEVLVDSILAEIYGNNASQMKAVVLHMYTNMIKNKEHAMQGMQRLSANEPLMKTAAGQTMFTKIRTNAEEFGRNAEMATNYYNSLSGEAMGERDRARRTAEKREAQAARRG